MTYNMARQANVWLALCHILWQNVLMEKPAIIDLIDKLDAEEVCKRLDVKPRSLRLARERGVFPASWYPAIQSICAAQGIDCPLGVFNWKHEVAS